MTTKPEGRVVDVRIETTLVCEHPPDGLTMHTVTLVVDDEDVGTFSAWVVEIGEVTPEDLDDITAELGRLASVLMLPDGSVNCPGPDEPPGSAVLLLTGSDLGLIERKTWRVVIDRVAGVLGRGCRWVAALAAQPHDLPDDWGLDKGREAEVPKSIDDWRSIGFRPFREHVVIRAACHCERP